MFIQLIPSIKTNSTHFKITIDVLTKLKCLQNQKSPGCSTWRTPISDRDAGIGNPVKRNPNSEVQASV